MAADGDAVTNATLKLVGDMQTYFEVSEQTATMAIGVSIGVAVSCVILLCMCCSSKVIYVTGQKLAFGRGCCAATAMESATPALHTNSAENDTTSAPGPTGTESVFGTEGAYRSDSESDDEGEGAKAAAVAQKRARSNVIQ